VPCPDRNHTRVKKTQTLFIFQRDLQRGNGGEDPLSWIWKKKPASSEIGFQKFVVEKWRFFHKKDMAESSCEGVQFDRRQTAKRKSLDEGLAPHPATSCLEVKKLGDEM